MDPLSEVISLLEPKSYHAGGFEAGGDWSIRFHGYAGVKCYAVARGSCWLILEDIGEPVLLQQGDCFLLPHGLPFRITSDPALTPEDWKPYFLGFSRGALVKLNEGKAVTVLGGHFSLTGPLKELLIGMLPPIVVARSEPDRETMRWAFDRMRQELVEPRPGGYLIVQQFVYMIFVHALRLHLDESDRAGWIFALSDKQVSSAIAAMHREPARRWTVASLASEVGMSRSGFAARFAQLVGGGPIEYLTRWRMLLARRGLVRGEPIGAIARSLGYESETAFSTAFKRVMGGSPRQHARSALAAGLTESPRRQASRFRSTPSP